MNQRESILFNTHLYERSGARARMGMLAFKAAIAHENLKHARNTHK